MHMPRKRFGQHFLSSPNVIAHIVELLQPAAGEHLVEIGAGQGALTVPVLKIAKSLEVIEIDRDLIDELERRTHRNGHLKIFCDDALTFDFGALKQDARMLRIFGNLPYNISTPLLFHLLTYRHTIADMLFMLQKEVGERITARPGEKNYGRLSVMLQYYCVTDMLLAIPPSAFYPPPKVNSCIIKLTPYRRLPIQANDESLFVEMVRKAFGQRRKTLRNSLRGIVNDDDWAHIAIHSDARAENLSVNDFVAMANTISER